MNLVNMLMNKTFRSSLWSHKWKLALMSPGDLQVDNLVWMNLVEMIMNINRLEYFHATHMEVVSIVTWQFAI